MYLYILSEINALARSLSFILFLILVEVNITVSFVDSSPSTLIELKEFGINFKSLNIKLPKMKYLVSKKDKNLPSLSHFNKK